MKTRFTKILSLVLTLVLAVSLFPVAALPVRAEDTPDEPKVVQGLFGAKFGKYQVFDVQRQTAYPQGTQESPSNFHIALPKDPIKIAAEATNLDFNLVPAFEETGYCYFAPVGKARAVGFTGNLRDFVGQDNEAEVDPFIVDMFYHAADGREMLVGRGPLGALSPDGFLFFHPAKNNSSFYYGVFVSTKTGFVPPYFYGSSDYLWLTPYPGGRVVNDRALLDNLIIGQMLGKHEDRPLLYTLSEWIWNEDNSEACAVFTCAETDDLPVTAEAELVTVGTTAASCTQDATQTVKAVAVMATQTFTSPERTRVLTGTATGHQWNGGEPVKAATCIAMGDTKYTCTVPGCGETEIRTDVAIDPTHHVNTEEVAETASSCYQAGYTAGVWCNDCETWVSGHEEKLLAEHSWQETERENANCRSEGYILYVCSVDGCGEMKRETLPVDPDAHSFGIRVHPATCTDEGYTAYTCVFCRYGYAKDEQPALGHEWSAPVWKWTGTSAATATFVCKNGDHPQTVTATVTSETVKAPTDTEAGKTVYTATVAFEGVTYTDTVEKTIPALNDGLCKWCGKDHSVSFWQRIVGFFHNILYFFAHLFGRR